MSIYPVPMQNWFKNRKRNDSDSKFLYETARWLVDIYRCHNCGKRCKWNRAWGHHSVPWGYGDIWCSKDCVFGKPKKRIGRHRKQTLTFGMG